MRTLIAEDEPLARDGLTERVADTPTQQSVAAVIVTTADLSHAVTAFELHVVDDLLNPYAHERFDEAVTHALATAERP